MGGNNKISVNLVANNVLVECINNFQHLTFKVDVSVINERQDATYSPVRVGKRGDCRLGIFGSMNSKIQQYASRYVGSGIRFQNLRGPALVAELEKKLGVQLGSTVTIPLNTVDGKPRYCGPPTTTTTTSTTTTTISTNTSGSDVESKTIVWIMSLF